MFEWATVEADGVPLVVEAPPGLDFLTADVARDPALTVFADFVTLFEEDPGRYEGTALTLLFDQQEDPGTYYWQASYFASPDDPAPVVGPVRSFAIGVPSAAPSVAIGLPAKLFAGRQAEAPAALPGGLQPGRRPAAPARDPLAVPGRAGRPGGSRAGRRRRTAGDGRAHGAGAVSPPRPGAAVRVRDGGLGGRGAGGRIGRGRPPAGEDLRACCAGGSVRAGWGRCGSA